MPILKKHLYLHISISTRYVFPTEKIFVFALFAFSLMTTSIYRYPSIQTVVHPHEMQNKWSTCSLVFLLIMFSFVIYLEPMYRPISFA